MEIKLEDVGETVVRMNLRKLGDYLSAVFDDPETKTPTRAVANCYLLLVRVTLAVPDPELLRTGYRSIYTLACDCADSMYATDQRTAVYGQVKRHLEGVAS